MRRISVMIHSWTVLDGGGTNRSNENRLGVLLHETLNRLWQEEN